MITAAIQNEVEKAIQKRIVSVAPLSAANNAQIYCLTTDTGYKLVAKVAERGLDTEAYMLGYLKEHSQLPVPKIYYSNEHVIIMEYIQAPGTVDHQGQRHAAEVLAALHKVKADLYGLDRDTLIGALRQPNNQTKDWPAFFSEHRLIYMAAEAIRERKMDAKAMKQIEKLAARLPALLKDANPPSLIHGDVWGGNILAGHGKVMAFLDPAIYYADFEIELAFIKLFNTFNDAFFARYGELNPIKAGFFEERADIYSLYPLLVHTRLFGASYARKAQKILDRFA